MYTRTITYTDYDGNERTEEFMFNLNKAELIKLLTMSGDYTLDKMLLRLQTERNGKKIMEIFENILMMAYGKKSLDGRRFEKTEEVKRDFKETEAFSVLFTELVTDADKAAEFINQVIPKELAQEMSEVLEKHPDAIPAQVKDYIPKK